MDTPSVVIYTLIVGFPMIGIMYAYQSQLGDEGYMVWFQWSISKIDASERINDSNLLSYRMKYFIFRRHNSTAWVVSMSGIPKLQHSLDYTTYRLVFMLCCSALSTEGALSVLHWDSALLPFFEW
jgi:hypothetical protein